MTALALTLALLVTIGGTHEQAPTPRPGDLAGSRAPLEPSPLARAATGEGKGGPLGRVGRPADADRGTSSEIAGAVGSVLISGVATWYQDGDGFYGSVPSWSFGDAPYKATVCHEGACVVVTVRGYCACGDRAGKATLIDLSPEAFERLAPLSAGVIDVTLEVGGLALPPTDTIQSAREWRVAS